MKVHSLVAWGRCREDWLKDADLQRELKVHTCVGGVESIR